jgi:hypothetical protein
MIWWETAPTGLKIVEFAKEDMFSEIVPSKVFCKVRSFVAACVSNIHEEMVTRQSTDRFCQRNLCLEVNFDDRITLGSQVWMKLVFGIFEKYVQQVMNVNIDADWINDSFQNSILTLRNYLYLHRLLGRWMPLQLRQINLKVSLSCLFGISTPIQSHGYRTGLSLWIDVWWQMSNNSNVLPKYP